MAQPAATGPVSEPPPCKVGIGYVLLRIAAPLWAMGVPIGVLTSALASPLAAIRLLRRLFGGRPGGPPAALQTFISGPAESEARDVILFVHGWPDHAAMWDEQVAACVAQSFRCITVTLPGFDGASDVGMFGYDFEEVSDRLIEVIDTKVAKKRVTLFLHDWGCTFGYNVAARRPDMVKRIVALDVGSDLKMARPMVLFTVSYQFFNVVAFLLGWPGGDLMNRFFLTTSGYRARPIRDARSALNYPYLHFWKRLLLGRGPPAGIRPTVECPVWYGYAEHKPGPFHSNRWLKWLNDTQGCETHSFRCGHWITVDKGAELTQKVMPWLLRAKL
eukprot:TRINITY_DN47032_c0_g1_i1.p1 TRINITY_DN47032_c0_g1~~TRINITY_DN47032_c0_g1_i1.p1  ORF type:complete len:358 (+),score=104.65 TRINITY_DN47032_c0_g1_i1:84-1076(+)